MAAEQVSDKARSFDPEDRVRVKHTKVGVWDLYEELPCQFDHVPGASRVERILEIKQNLPYLWRMMKEFVSIENCGFLLCITLSMQLLIGLIPAITLWYSGQMLAIINTAISTRTVDKGLLLRISLGDLFYRTLSRFLYACLGRIRPILERRIKRHFDQRLFCVRSQLDLPTSEDPIVQRQLAGATLLGRGSIAARTFGTCMFLMRATANVGSQCGVHMRLLREQPDGLLLVVLVFVSAWLEQAKMFSPGFVSARVWAATTKNQDYLRMQGCKQIVDDLRHRKELIAGNLVQYLVSQFMSAANLLGDDEGDFEELSSDRHVASKWNPGSFLSAPLAELPKIIFTIRAAHQPASIPVTLTSLHLIEETAGNLSYEIQQLYRESKYLTEELADVRRLYDVEKIPNRIVDGADPFPEDMQKINTGISVEFRNVSFKYPGANTYALSNASFKLLAGQLCIIVGSNGSGKSTILKLIVRLYDPDDGEILIGGRNIQTLKLSDLRQAISVLFQDYTLFPLSIRDNIGLGDPEHADDEERIGRAAELGGASEIIARLPDGLDTYIDRPAKDHYGDLPTGIHTLFGRHVDYGGLRAAGDMSSVTNIGLSGGQMQRLAVLCLHGPRARSFMRSMVSNESRVGLLLFDEPSASLDVSAEYDLFTRLRELRGNKTMLFSSHRFGNLTRHADVILYMNDSVIVESGTHEKLLAHNGKYAQLWKLQAQAFL
ncbi:P-loop containing nucleoside triphosphate hydrolase protein [Obba rivulosa]|uniref:P-loop containing nucleoside triphosphate hydrolase protein n=1 Tax=Obba rivulosa TaxID=1052685 RepID=A0A8E2DEF6_9APHY|nr:P-loop containing nucleoside triphosphate hydrolase protein [Obba rivulosa]